MAGSAAERCGSREEWIKLKKTPAPPSLPPRFFFSPRVPVPEFRLDEEENTMWRIAIGGGNRGKTPGNTTGRYFVVRDGQADCRMQR